MNSWRVRNSYQLLSIFPRQHEWGMGNGEWGMGNGEWGMGNGEWDDSGEWEIKMGI